MKLQGKIALVTGASRGIGKAIAVAMAEAGADVVCNATTEGNAEDTAVSVREKGRRAVAVGARVEDAAAVKAMFDRAEKEIGPVDILVNNAGIPKVVPLLEITEEEWDSVMDINLKGTMLCSQEAVRRMQGRGAEGIVLNIGSVAGVNAAPLRGVYCASKAAVHQLTKVMAIEWAELGVRVNCIAPGFIRTDIMEGLIRAGKLDMERIEQRVPQRRVGTVTEVADAAVYLAGTEAAYVTGSILMVDGGYTAYGFL